MEYNGAARATCPWSFKYQTLPKVCLHQLDVHAGKPCFFISIFNPRVTHNPRTHSEDLKKEKKFEPLTVCLHWSGGYTIVYLFYVTIVSSGPVHAFIYKCSHFIHVFILEREFAACFTWKMAIFFATSWLFGKTEAELRGGGVRWWRGPPWPLLSSPPSISPSQLLLHWDGLRETPPPPPLSEKAPSYEIQYKLN